MHAPGWSVVLASATLTMPPTVAAVVLVQRWFVQGLLEMER